jgi:hypothetical protein
MAKDEKPVDELSVAKLTMNQANGVIDMYFDTLQKAISSYPPGGTEFAEKLKVYAQRNVATTHEFVKQLSGAKDFQEVVLIQAEFMQSLMSAFGDQTKSLSEEYTKAATDVLKKPFAGTS